MEVSRDRKNPTWGYVWDSDERPENPEKRIIIETFDDGWCSIIARGNEKRYMDDKDIFTAINFVRHYEIIDNGVNNGN